MNGRTRRRIVISCCVGAAVMLGPTAARSQPAAARQEAVSITVDSAATRRLAAVIDPALAGDGERAATALAEFELSAGDALVDVEPRRTLRVGLAVQVLRAQLAPADRRLRDDPLAATLLDDALALEDAASLQDVWQRFPGTSAAAQAINAAAEFCWRDDRLDAAAAQWRLLRPRAEVVAINPADALRIAPGELTSAEIAARGVLVELYSGDTVRASELTRRFAAEHPTAEGYLNGRRGPLLNALDDAWVAEPRSPARNLRQPLLAGAPVWRTPLDASFTAGRWFNRPMLSPATPPPILPAATPDAVFWSRGGGVHGLQIDDGGALWSADDSSRDTLVFGAADGGGYPLTQAYIGELLQSVAVDAGRLYAVLGTPFAIASVTEPRPMEMQLVCLDVDRQEGKLLWSCTPRGCCLDDAWRFSGPPAVAGATLLIPVRRGLPRVEVGVVCLRANDGAPLWFQTVAGLLSQPPRAIHVVTADRLTTAYGRTFLTGDWGGAACLETASGRIEWVRRDDPLPWTTPPLIPTGEVAGRGAVCHRGVMYAVEHDDRSIVALDTLTGALEWRRTLPSRVRQLVGVHSGRLIAAGDQVWGLDVDDGTPAWRSGFDDVEGAVAGEALLSGATVLYCTPDELWQLDALTGQPVRRLPLWDAYGVRGGHIVAAGRRILIASADELVALRTLNSSAP